MPRASADDLLPWDRCAQARCNGTSAIQAWDFQNTTSTAYNMRLMYNGTARGDQGPPVILRVNQVGYSTPQLCAASTTGTCTNGASKLACCCPSAFLPRLQHSMHSVPHLPLLQGINRATNAFLQWALGDTYQTWLLGLQEMPKVGRGGAGWVGLSRATVPVTC